MEIIEIQELGRDFSNGQFIADRMFSTHSYFLTQRVIDQVQMLRVSGSWSKLLANAEVDLEKWSVGGKKQAYTADSLALARVSREVANQYEKEKALELMNLNAVHQTILAHSFFKNDVLLNKLIQEGKAGRKFGLVEMADRLGPILQPTGSSAYYHVKYVPYGVSTRSRMGEAFQEGASLVSAATAVESTSNLVNMFGVHYALAETSAATKADVPKSGRKPEVHICTKIAYQKPIVESFQIDTLFRTEFDAQVRERMYRSLERMYTCDGK
ncbi:MAG: hypothetical protein WCI72_05845 [archaeon]